MPTNGKIRKGKIKEGLECCGKDTACRGHCPYCGTKFDINSCTGKLSRDALALINKLEADNKAKAIVLEQLERERDAAVEILRSMHCDTCIYDEHYPIPNVCFDCIEYCNWEWRGVKEEKDENT